MAELTRVSEVWVGVRYAPGTDAKVVMQGEGYVKYFRNGIFNSALRTHNN